MIVVLGSPAGHLVEGAVRPGSLSGWIALAAADAGAPVQVVGRIGDDRAGDAVVLALAQAGVGHAALLRDPARPTGLLRVDDEWQDDVSDEPALAAATPAQTGPSVDAEDVALGLRYLTAFSVLVIADPLDPAAMSAALDAAAFAGARTVAVVADAASVAADDVFVPPDGDLRRFAAMVGRYVAALATSRSPEEALRDATARTGWAATVATPVDDER
jgi:sugar/nucleoside kinase (ribokinase family)